MVCDKIVFPDEQSAVRRLMEITADMIRGTARRSDHLPIAAYECEFCWAYHLTSRPRSTQFVSPSRAER
jgi:hypothetical protein